MSVLTQQIEINNKTYSVTQLLARRSLKVLLRLGAKLTPALAKMQGTKDLLSLDVSSLGSALEALFTNLEPADIDFFIDELLTTARRDNKLIHGSLDIEFQGNPYGLVRLLVFAVQLNFASFFDAFKNLRDTAPPKA